MLCRASNIVGRLLLGTVPGMDLLYRDGFGQGTGEHGMQEIIASLSPAGQLASLATPQIWIGARSEEHTSELQSLMRISYAVFCLQKKTQHNVNYDDNYEE